jgi:DNA polymerase III subunit gamma/tau
VAWMLLHNASVLSIEDGVLTLRFAREGEMKGFSVSGHDAVLKRVLSADFGLDVMVRGVTGAAGEGRPASAAADPGPAQVQQAPARSRPRHDEPPPPDDFPSDEPDDIPPDEPGAGQAPRGTELTGMDLIQRELGGQVIGEIED